MATKPITRTELVDVLPIVKSILQKQKTPILSRDLEMITKHILDIKNIDYRLCSDRLRVIINYLRAKEILPIISSSRGYHVNYKKLEMVVMAESLEMRAKSIMSAARGLKRMSKKYKN
jgi:hypothetical protein